MRRLGRVIPAEKRVEDAEMMIVEVEMSRHRGGFYWASLFGGGRMFPEIPDGRYS